MLMQNNTVLEVEGLSKLYSRSPATTRSRLAKTFTRTLFGRSFHSTNELDKGEFWSLKDINFILKRGEALGIIGLNGAGKTTLLRILAGQMLPDQGEIRMLGKSAAMIDLTAGFQISSSGARNIYLRGAMLGRNKEEITTTYDEIVDFAELGDAINAPVGTYSSGMLMRLAFSIMVAMKPDVLFIDEILSVGDFRFRQKCLSKIRELRERSAFVLVSHSMSDIKSFCDHAIYLSEGQIVVKGTPEDVVSIYEKMQMPKVHNEKKRQTKLLEPQYRNENVVREIEHYWCDKEGKAITEICSGKDLYLSLTFILNFKPRNLILGVPVWRNDGVYVTGFSTNRDGVGLEIESNKKYKFILNVPNIPFNPGIYISNIAIHDGPEFLYRGENSQLTVINKNDPYWGVISIPNTWKIMK